MEWGALTFYGRKENQPFLSQETGHQGTDRFQMKKGAGKADSLLSIPGKDSRGKEDGSSARSHLGGTSAIPSTLTAESRSWGYGSTPVMDMGLSWEWL